jgi:hypothetical protein
LQIIPQARGPHDIAKQSATIADDPLAAQVEYRNRNAQQLPLRRNTVASEKRSSNMYGNPPPPYQPKSRRFTSFDMLGDQRRGTMESRIAEEEPQKQQDGIFQKLTRSWTVKGGQSQKQSEQQNKKAGVDRLRSIRRGTV